MTWEWVALIFLTLLAIFVFGVLAVIIIIFKEEIRRSIQ